MSKKLTQKEFENKFYKMYAEKYKIIGQYQNAFTPVKIECLSCSYQFSQTPNHFDKNQTKCPVCNKNGNTKKVIRGVNDIWTIRPDVGELLSNKEDGYLYRPNSTIEISFTCPICKRIKMIRPVYVSNNGFNCQYCSDGISYPNKLMCNILDILKIPFQTEYKIGTYSFRYDFYFTYNDINYLIEMDGAFGHGCINTPNLSVQEQIKIDNQKNIIAKDNGFHLIRIDCKYKTMNERFQYICNQIYQSDLSLLFPISEQVLVQANLQSQQSNVYKFAELWNDHLCSYDELIGILHIHRGTIRKYAKQCIELNLINDTYEQFLSKIRIGSNVKLSHSKGQRILCEQTNEVFYSIVDAMRKTGFTSLPAYFSQNRKYCGQLANGTKLTWRKISDAEYQKILIA